MADKPKFIEHDYYPLEPPTDTSDNLRRLKKPKSQILAEIKKAISKAHPKKKR